MLKIVLAVATFGLALFALIDVIRTEDDRVRHLPKLVWLLVVLFFPLVGSLAWLIVGRERTVPEMLRDGSVADPGAARAVAPGLPLDPETDEQFQRRFRARVEQQRRDHAARQAREDDGPGEPPAAD
ncbi:MAG: PLD nuclease N-terminal domain-containing protein [Nocardioides sp.]|uniref:PLD nuclease N-terminal domain-containing protein n=1 Tax=Nocardioides sp. TaxID=35761 RepID=UPI003F059255